VARRGKLGAVATIREREGSAWPYRAEVKRKGIGKGRWSRQFRTKAAARRWVLEVEGLLDQGVDPAAEPGGADSPTMPTVLEWHERWWKARVAEPTTMDGNESRLRNHVLPRWGSVPLDRVRPLEVQAWVKSLSKEKGLAPATVSSCHQLLRRMMSAAVNEGLVAGDPCAHTMLPTIPKGLETYWTEKQVDAIAASVHAPSVRLSAHQRDLGYVVILTFAYTGLRWGELTGLRKGRLELLKRRLLIRGVWTRHGYKEYPKSAKSRRTVPLPEWLCELLAEYLAKYPADDGDYVFRGDRGGPLHGSNFCTRVWHPALAASGALDGNVHDLRHTYASWLVQRGRTLEEVKALMGHASITTTEMYAHFAPDHGSNAVSVLERGASGARGSVSRLRQTLADS
jgi:integrase